MKELILDASGTIAGRIASVAAKELLRGNKVIIVNAEHAVINGNPTYTKNMFYVKVERGDPWKGPFAARMPDRMLKRIVRGMVPFNKPLGKIAFKNLRVYISIPEALKGREIKKVSAGTPHRKSMTIGEVSSHLRGGK